MHYSISDNQQKRMLLKIDKELYNLNKQNEVLGIVAEAITAYGDKVYNKRFATFTNKKLIDVFGSKMYERYGRDDEEIGNAYCYMTTEEFVKKHTYFHFSYESKEIRTDWDGSKGEYLGDSRDHEELYGSDTLPELAEAIKSKLAYNTNCIQKITDNRDNLDALIASFDTVSKSVDAHNAQITYVLSDDLRVK